MDNKEQNSATTPPSFRPQRPVVRPTATGAKIVGTPPAPTSGSKDSNLDTSKQAVPPVIRPATARATTRPTIRSATSVPINSSASSSNNSTASTHASPPSFLPQTRRSSEDAGRSSRNIATAGTNTPVPNKPFSPDTQRQADIKAALSRIKPPKTPLQHLKRALKIILALLLSIILGISIWGIHLYRLGSSHLSTVPALSAAPDTEGTTYLIVGSDKRDASSPEGDIGERSDTVMLLHKVSGKPPVLLSIPRDTVVEIPGNGTNKINAAFSIGGAPLLVETVEQLTGIKIDHYVQIGMYGLVSLTDAVGGVELCYDSDVNDPYSNMNWTAGCHMADGNTALSFARMRYADALGDVGRGERQRQVISAILQKAFNRDVLFSPSKQKELVIAGSQTVTVDTNDGLKDVAWAGWYLRNALQEGGISGTPPIASLNHYIEGLGSTVLLADNVATFWEELKTGTLNPANYDSLTQH